MSTWPIFAAATGSTSRCCLTEAWISAWLSIAACLSPGIRPWDRLAPGVSSANGQRLLAHVPRRFADHLRPDPGGCAECGSRRGAGGTWTHLAHPGPAAFMQRPLGRRRLCFLGAGPLREASLFGYNLLLTRTISCRLGEARLTIEDRVENQGSAPAPHMILYHFNPGFPDARAQSRLDVSSTVEPRDAVAAPGLVRHNRFEEPTSGYAEQLFYHRVAADAGGFAQVALVNPDLRLGLQVRYRHRELPWLVEWKQVGVGAYVLGVEPGNCVGEGRAAAARGGVLVELAPARFASTCSKSAYSPASPDPRAWRGAAVTETGFHYQSGISYGGLVAGILRSARSSVRFWVRDALLRRRLAVEQLLL